MAGRLQGNVMTMKWNGRQAVSLIDAEVGKRVDAAARVLRDRAKELISRGQPVKIYGKAAGRSRKGLDPSKAGEPPKMVSGHLRLNVKKEHSGLEARVGTNVPYGKWLELGTGGGKWTAVSAGARMAPRPWLSKAVYESAAELQRRFGIGITI